MDDEMDWSDLDIWESTRSSRHDGQSCGYDVGWTLGDNRLVPHQFRVVPGRCRLLEKQSYDSVWTPQIQKHWCKIQKHWCKRMYMNMQTNVYRQ
jgi:hypothetical protein